MFSVGSSLFNIRLYRSNFLGYLDQHAVHRIVHRHVGKLRVGLHLRRTPGHVQQELMTILVQHKEPHLLLDPGRVLQIIRVEPRDVGGAIQPRNTKPAMTKVLSSSDSARKPWMRRALMSDAFRRRQLGQLERRQGLLRQRRAHARRRRARRGRRRPNARN